MEPTPPGFVSLLRTYLAGMKWQVSGLAVLLVATTSAQVVGPLLLGSFVDGAIGGDSLNSLYLLAGAFLCATIAAQVLVLGAAYAAKRDVVTWRT